MMVINQRIKENYIKRTRYLTKFGLSDLIIEKTNIENIKPIRRLIFH